MKLRKRDLFLLVAAPALMLGAIGAVGGVKAVSEVKAADSESKVVTYTVKDKTSVTAYGDAPEGSSADYSQTYNTVKQITKDNSATLTVSGFGGCKIEHIALSMKSNSDKGAGSCVITVGEKEIANSGTKTFDKFFDSTDYSGSYKTVNASLDENPVVGEGEDLKIVIAATKNSLYIESYTITWSSGAPAEDNFETTFATNETLSNLSFNYSHDHSEAAPTVAAWPTKNGETFPKSTKKAIVGAVTISTTSGLGDNYEEIRVYSGCKLTISSEKTITKIEFVGNDNKNPLSNLSTKEGNYKIDSSDKTKATWTGEATSIEFSASAQARINKLSITYIDEGETYSFSDVKMQFRYELPHSGDNDIGVKYASDLSSVTEKGLFITDDNETENLFKTVDKDSFQIAEGKTGHFYKNGGAGEKGMSYTVGVMIPEDKYETELIGVSYVLKDGKYMWGKEKKYSVYQLLNVYSTREDVSEENQNICKAFMSYIESNRA